MTVLTRLLRGRKAPACLFFTRRSTLRHAELEYLQIQKPPGVYHGQWLGTTTAEKRGANSRNPYSVNPPKCEDSAAQEKTHLSKEVGSVPQMTDDKGTILNWKLIPGPLSSSCTMLKLLLNLED
jgi:hypothetical protein